MLRRLQVVILSAVLVVAAFSTGESFLFFLVYLIVLVVGGSYVLTRLGLTDLEAGYAVNQLTGHVGEQLRVTYTVRHAGRIPKPWLEIHNPTNLPSGLPGRAISLGSHAERSWLVRLQLTRRGHFRIEPLQIRTGDPFGFFEAAASVGHGVTLVVYPRIDRLPLWRLPNANIEGSHSAPERTMQTTPLATSVRPWAPGDSFNRIHWKTTARHGDIQVKEFDLEQTADVWIVLDLQRAVQAGRGEQSTTEVAVRAAASIASRSLLENRSVGLTINGHRTTLLPADRGGRQHLKIMQLLAAVEADGTAPLAEALIESLPRLRRGMTAVVITSSEDGEWVRPLASLRTRGVGCIVVSLDRETFATEAGRRAAVGVAESGPGVARGPSSGGDRAVRALRHVLAEYDLPVRVVTAGTPLAEALVG